jgi:hypothetical protein
MKAIHNRLRKLEGSFNVHDTGEYRLSVLLRAWRRCLAASQGDAYIEPAPVDLGSMSRIQVLNLPSVQSPRAVTTFVFSIHFSMAPALCPLFPRFSA